MSNEPKRQQESRDWDVNECGSGMGCIVCAAEDKRSRVLFRIEEVERAWRNRTRCDEFNPEWYTERCMDDEKRSEAIKALERWCERELENRTKRIWLPLWWYLVLLSVFVSGFFLMGWNPNPPFLNYLPKRLHPENWWRIVGIFMFFGVLAHLLLFVSSRFIMDRLLRLHGRLTDADRWSPALVGICESVMYPTALLLGQPGFIGVWLAIKVAGQWMRWNKEPNVNNASIDSDECLNAARRRFNGFLANSALSIMCGVAIYGLVIVGPLQQETEENHSRASTHEGGKTVEYNAISWTEGDLVIAESKQPSVAPIGTSSVRCFLPSLVTGVYGTYL